ncbi:LOW QUALITY PROTEIN: hypothetical protein U9M48_025566, partial [Paspalum notatum var. saurae]
MLVLVPRLLDVGICFGFADPVTNIVANTLSILHSSLRRLTSPPLWSQRLVPPRSGSGREEEVLSKIIASDSPPLPETHTVAKRSLKGLVRFRTTYFRHLPTCDALCYLYLAWADLLVVVCVIQDDRCCHRSEELRMDSLAVDVALKCAAFSARLPH